MKDDLVILKKLYRELTSYGRNIGSYYERDPRAVRTKLSSNTNIDNHLMNSVSETLWKYRRKGVKRTRWRIINRSYRAYS